MGEAKPRALLLADLYDEESFYVSTNSWKVEACIQLRAQHAEIESLRAEAAENARIIGMSAEREAALRAQVEALRVDGERLAKLHSMSEWDTYAW